MTGDTVIVVGSGIAGGELATALRQEGFGGGILMVGDEPYLPYHRPPLSKTYLAGAVSVESLTFKPQATYQKKQIDLLSGVRVERIERTARRIVLANGKRLPYAKLVLALGGRPRMLDAWKSKEGRVPSNLHAIRTIDDVDRLRPQFRAGTRLVIVGGGFIGLEVAAVASKAGLRVAVVESLPRVLARVTAPVVSRFYEGVHREAGVDMRTGTGIRGFEFGAQADTISAVVCEDGTTIAADLVIAGIGIIPNVEVAEDAGLGIQNGILVDENMRSSDPDIFSIGDCANHPNWGSGRRVRLESVANALEQARTAAATICGRHSPYRSVPWFWSDQYDLKLQIAGLSEGHEDVVVRGSLAGHSFAVVYLKEGRVIAVDAVNRARDFAILRTFVAEKAFVDPGKIADESVPLAKPA